MESWMTQALYTPLMQENQLSPEMKPRSVWKETIDEFKLSFILDYIYKHLVEILRTSIYTFYIGMKVPM